MPPKIPSPVFHFGEYRLDPASQELLKDERSVKLQPLHFNLLTTLVENSDRIVTREELRQKLWGPDTFVDFEAGLNHCVRVLRATLSDDAQTPRFIETVPKRGYRFIAPVTATSTTPEPEPLPPVPTAPIQQEHQPARSLRNLRFAITVATVLAIAATALLWYRSGKPSESRKIVVIVLPFQNLSEDANEDYLSEGVTEELTSYLGKINPQRLAVIGRTSAARLAASGKDVPQIARETGAEYVVEGSVRRVGDHIRIVTQLTRARDNTSVWTDSFDGEFNPATVLAMESEFVDSAGNVMTKVLQVNPVKLQQTNAAAFEAFLKGRYYWNRRSLDGFKKAVEYFDLAIRNDPRYAPAYAGKADALALFLEYYENGAPPGSRQSAFDAAKMALSLDDSLPEAHTSLAFLEWRYNRDFIRAEKEFQRSIELDPNSSHAHHWYALFLASRRRFSEAKLQLEIARRIDPMSLVILTNIGWVSYFERDFDKAARQYRAVAEMDPVFLPVHVKLAWVYQQQKRWKEAAAEVRRQSELVGAPKFGAKLDDIYRTSGYPALLAEVLQANHDWGPLAIGEYEQARMRLIMGDRDSAVRLLQQCEANQSPWLAFLNVEPAFDALHSDPQFQALAARVNSQSAALIPFR